MQYNCKKYNITAVKHNITKDNCQKNDNINL